MKSCIRKFLKGNFLENGSLARAKCLYTPPIFEEQDESKIKDFIVRYSFATILAQNSSGQVTISYAPFYLNREENALYAHFARQNPLGQLFKQNGDVTLLFNGPHGYISPSWYSSPKEFVPTWNYSAVHVYGSSEEVKSPEEKIKLLMKSVSKYERDGWLMENYSEEKLAKKLTQIVGVKIQIKSFEAKFKMSQDTSSEDIKGVIKGLEARKESNDAELAEMIKKLNNL